MRARALFHYASLESVKFSLTVRRSPKGNVISLRCEDETRPRAIARAAFRSPRIFPSPFSRGQRGSNGTHSLSFSSYIRIYVYTSRNDEKRLTPASDFLPSSASFLRRRFSSLSFAPRGEGRRKRRRDEGRVSSWEREVIGIMRVMRDTKQEKKERDIRRYFSRNRRDKR